MDQFSRYENDLLLIIKATKIKLADRIPISEKEERKTLIRDVNKHLDEINVIIGDMEREVNKAGPNSRVSMSTKLRQYKKDVELMQKDLNKKASSTNLMNNYGSTSNAVDNITDPERRTVIQIQQTLNKTSDSIARSTQIAIETENIGNDVLTELDQQGQQLKRATQRLDDTNAEISRSRRILNKLSRSIFCNRFVLIILVILELCILGGVIFWKFFT